MTLAVQVETDVKVEHVLSARLQQAFLPKFENEGQDMSIASTIVQQVRTHRVELHIMSTSCERLCGEGQALSQQTTQGGLWRCSSFRL